MATTKSSAEVTATTTTSATNVDELIENLYHEAAQSDVISTTFFRAGYRADLPGLLPVLQQIKDKMVTQTVKINNRNAIVKRYENGTYTIFLLKFNTIQAFIARNEDLKLETSTLGQFF